MHVEGDMASETYKSRYERHLAEMADGTVWAENRVFGLPFSGQRNFGGIGPEPGRLPSFGVTTSDGWMYAFHAREDAEAFIVAHPKREVA